MISPKATGWILGGAHFVIWCVFGLWVIPTFTHIFADMLAGEPLPRLTQGVIMFGPGGCLLVATVGGGLLVESRLISRLRFMHLSLVFFSGLALVYGVIALAWPFLLIGNVG